MQKPVKEAETLLAALSKAEMENLACCDIPIFTAAKACAVYVLGKKRAAELKEAAKPKKAKLSH